MIPEDSAFQPRGLYVTFAVAAFVCLSLAALVAWPKPELSPTRRTTFELDVPSPAAPAPAPSR
jgi:hypothetical protein